MEHGLSCSAAMWDLPRPGLEPMSPTLAGRFLTTAPPGKPLHGAFLTWPPLGKAELEQCTVTCVHLLESARPGVHAFEERNISRLPNNLSSHSVHSSQAIWPHQVLLWVLEMQNQKVKVHQWSRWDSNPETSPSSHTCLRPFP